MFCIFSVEVLNNFQVFQDLLRRISGLHKWVFYFVFLLSIYNYHWSFYINLRVNNLDNSLIISNSSKIPLKFLCTPTCHLQIMFYFSNFIPFFSSLHQPESYYNAKWQWWQWTPLSPFPSVGKHSIFHPYDGCHRFF